jgi:acetyl-CoA C-acetyltransferase
MSLASDVVVVGAARTPLGSFGGTLRDVSVWDLGAAAIRAALDRAGVRADQVDQAILANCRQAGNGTNSARTAAVRGGIPTTVPAFTVNMACPSGMKAVMLAHQELASGSAGIIVAGGMESMSTMPYLLKNARWRGFKAGDRVLQDSWSDGAVDPICGLSVGMTAEGQAAKYGISRAEQDEFAAGSHQKAAKARGDALSASEIVPFQLEPTRDLPEGLVISHDEAIRPDSNAAALARLKAVFKADGSVTAGNACAMGDGACAMVVTTRQTAKALGLTPLFSIVSFAQVGCDPALMGDGPAYSIPLALAKAGMTVGDVDFIEINEPFAVSVLANQRTLGCDPAKMNVHGGAIALTHPTGVSGARILGTLDNILRRQNKEIGLAAICGGGGISTAMVIRREH